MTPTQCRMARSGLGWSIKDLGSAAGMTPNTVSRFENGKDSYTSTASRLEKALLDSGKVRFEGKEWVCVEDTPL